MFIVLHTKLQKNAPTTISVVVQFYILCKYWFKYIITFCVLNNTVSGYAFYISFMSKIPPFKRSSHTFVRGRQSQSVPELFSSSKAVMAALPEHCVLYRQVRGVPIAPWCVSLLPLFFLPPFLLPSWPAMLVLAPAAQPSPSINLHMCWREGGGYRQQ